MRDLEDFRDVGALDSEGLRHGLWETRDAQDRVRFSRTYVAGVPHGSFERKHRDGSTLESGRHDNGKRVGTFVAFYADGSPWFRYEFDDDRPVGVWELWHPGNIRSRRIDWALDAEDPARTVVFGIDDKPGTLLGAFPAERRPPGALIVFDGVHWTALSGGAEPVVFDDVPAPRLRPGTLWATGGTEIHDAGFPFADELALIHQAAFMGPFLLEPLDDLERITTVNRHAIAMEHLSKVAGDALRLPVHIDVMSRLFLIEPQIDDDSFDEVIQNMRSPSFDRLTACLRELGAHERAAVLDAARTGRGPGFLAKLRGRTRFAKYLDAPPPQLPQSPLAWVNDDFASR